MRPDELSFVARILLLLTSTIAVVLLLDGQPLRAALITMFVGGILIGLIQLYVNYLRLYED